tara:strand:- start:862 stop:1056 length:195 start_codon:yes stop_codon:yes gene_type:complete
MLIKRKSMVSGTVSEMDIDVTPTQIDAWYWQGELIQNAMPNISAQEREFIKSGITPTEWDEIFN